MLDKRQLHTVACVAKPVPANQQDAEATVQIFFKQV